MEFGTVLHTRRRLLSGIALGGAVLALPGCASVGGGYGLVDAVQRLLFLSSERAFGRMLQGGGFWDQQVAALGLANALGARGDVLSRILTSGLFKSRLDRAFGEIAWRGAERAAPIVTDAVRVIGFENAVDLVRAPPSAATAFLRGNLGTRLVDAMVPELGAAMRVASDPLVGQALAALTGVGLGDAATTFAASIDEVIWREIGTEEAAIRADPASTRDAAIIAVFGAARAI
ncbi:DUF4197 family protein [Qipengyuania sediminis]|uniref:DUF4197 family protein n=1 Tax=Qipengyuania sediminis TaxID=1532023 RepID=UPI00105953AC|nr:DUF4197 family protein [Qipengyuania sediminis]